MLNVLSLGLLWKSDRLDKMKIYVGVVVGSDANRTKFSINYCHQCMTRLVKTKVQLHIAFSIQVSTVDAKSHRASIADAYQINHHMFIIRYKFAAILCQDFEICTFGSFHLSSTSLIFFYPILNLLNLQFEFETSKILNLFTTLRLLRILWRQ